MGSGNGGVGDLEIVGEAATEHVRAGLELNFPSLGRTWIDEQSCHTLFSIIGSTLAIYLIARLLSTTKSAWLAPTGHRILSVTPRSAAVPAAADKRTLARC